MKFCRKVMIISVQCAEYNKLRKIPKLKCGQEKIDTSPNISLHFLFPILSARWCWHQSENCPHPPASWSTSKSKRLSDLAIHSFCFPSLSNFGMVCFCSKILAVLSSNIRHLKEIDKTKLAGDSWS
jgi:hypothetical protein